MAISFKIHGKGSFMLNNPMDVLTQFPVRKTKKQKQAFRDAVRVYAETLDYLVSVENGICGSKNLVIGDPNTAKYLITAHYDTSARILFPNLVTPFNPVLFALYQLFLSVIIVLIAAFDSVLIGAAVFFAGLIFAPPESGLVITVASILACTLGFVLLSILFCVLMLFGPANRNNSNDNTSGVVTLLETARTFPENQRNKVCFVLFDMDQKGLWGAKSYRKMHNAVLNRQLVINLDCVGDGDHIFVFPTKKVKDDRKKLTSLYKMCGYMGKKSIRLHEKGFSYYPSDHRFFPNGVGICALRKNKLCYYLSRIHTKRDTVLEETNINILRAALTTFICCDEVNQERK